MRGLAALALLVGALLPPAAAEARGTSIQSGYAAHYRPFLMEKVARKRGFPPGSNYVASPYHGIGTRLLVCRAGDCVEAVVADVCHPRDCARIRQRGIVVELSFPLARRLCGISRYAQEPPRACPVAVGVVTKSGRAPAAGRSGH